MTSPPSLDASDLPPRPGGKAPRREFESVLDPAGPAGAPTNWWLAQTLRDLNLDQVFTGAGAGREEYGLRPLYETSLQDPAAVRYRQAASRDLEREEVRLAVDGFAQAMRQLRDCQRRAQELHHELQRASWFQEAAHVYCRAVLELEAGLGAAKVDSAALGSLVDYLSGYVRSAAFTALNQEEEALRADLSRIRYTLSLKGSRVQVGRYLGGADLSQEVQQSFRKFQEGTSGDRWIRFPEPDEMNHVEAQILDLVARLFPEQFERLRAFCVTQTSFPDPTLVRFDREVQFYLGYHDLIAPVRKAGHAFCYPDLDSVERTTLALSIFDLALACRLVAEGGTLVANDVRLDGPERIIVITGPNQGGKTTLARAFGQLHYLARLGLPVPGSEVRLPRSDAVFTHFEKEEQAEDLKGKLEDELTRMRDILEAATEDSVVVMNESFSSTTLDDARLIGREVLRRLIGLGAVGVYVTFVDELSRLGPATVSMMSIVDPARADLRTFRVERRVADGLAYAVQLAEKHGLTHLALRRRLAP